MFKCQNAYFFTEFTLFYARTHGEVFGNTLQDMPIGYPWVFIVMVPTMVAMETKYDQEQRQEGMNKLRTLNILNPFKKSMFKMPLVSVI